MKKSFIVHLDSLDVLDDLTDEQAGQLLRAFKTYHEQGQIDLTPLVKVAFSPFKNQFDRDIEKYEKICERNRINGLRGGRPESQAKPEEPKEPSGLKSNPKNLDSDNDSDSDKEKLIGRKFDQFWKLYPKKVKKKEVIKKWKARKLEAKADILIADVEKRMQSQKWKDGFIPDPTTYINGDLWEDELILGTTENGEVKQWWHTAPGIREKGKEYGLREEDFDNFPYFKNAVFAKAKEVGDAPTR